MLARTALNTAGSFACALVLGACAGDPPPTQRFEFTLHARTPSGAAVAGVQVWADGRALGPTSDLGTLRAALRGREGGTVELTAACPPGYRTEPPERKVVLRRVRSTARARGGLALSVECRPREHAVALVVLASGNGSGVPIRVHGEAIGQTERDGSAHLLFGAAPHTSLRVELDTSARPELYPRNPVHTFRLADEDSVLLVEQRFESKPRARATPSRARPIRPPARPQRID